MTFLDFVGPTFMYNIFGWYNYFRCIFSCDICDFIYACGSKVPYNFEQLK